MVTPQPSLSPPPPQLEFTYSRCLELQVFQHHLIPLCSPMFLCLIYVPLSPMFPCLIYVPLSPHVPLPHLCSPIPPCSPASSMFPYPPCFPASSMFPCLIYVPLPHLCSPASSMFPYPPCSYEFPHITLIKSVSYLHIFYALKSVDNESILNHVLTNIS